MAVRRLRTGTVAVTLAGPLLLFALTGCSGDDSVADPPVSSATSSPTQSPQRESPEHFIRRWAEAEKRMENTGKTAEYLALSQGCGPCRKLASQVSGYYGAGGFVRWGGWRIRSIKPYPGQPKPLFAVHSVSRPTKYRRAAGSPIEHFSGGSITYVLSLKRDNQGWIVTNKSELDR